MYVLRRERNRLTLNIKIFKHQVWENSRPRVSHCIGSRFVEQIKRQRQDRSRCIRIIEAVSRIDPMVAL